MYKCYENKIIILLNGIWNIIKRQNNHVLFGFDDKFNVSVIFLGLMSCIY